MADNRKKRRSINNYGTGRQKLVRRLIKIAAWTIGILILLVAGLFTWLTITEYKPADIETVAVEGTADPVRDSGNKGMTIGENVTIMTWNVGYGALGDNADFFMDGGKEVKTADVDRVMANLKGIGTSIRLLDPDIVFLQDIGETPFVQIQLDLFFVFCDLFGYRSFGWLLIPVVSVKKASCKSDHDTEKHHNEDNGNPRFHELLNRVKKCSGEIKEKQSHFRVSPSPLTDDLSIPSVTSKNRSSKVFPLSSTSLLVTLALICPPCMIIVLSQSISTLSMM